MTNSKNWKSDKSHAPRIGLFGGTFDPVHTGHLIIAERIREEAALDTVIFIPSAQPPHKGADVMFSPRQRHDMLELATAGHDPFTVSDIEMRRSGPSYTIDTLHGIRADFPPGTGIYFIVGKDNLYEIETWKQPRDILGECTLLVADRRGNVDRPLPRWVKDAVEFVPTPIIEISSSDIRKRLKEHRSIRYLVPQAVETYIASCPNAP